MIKFRFNPQKAMQGVDWMLEKAGRDLDFHKILKTAYFADKRMLNEHGRPIFGARYRAMNYGPVPLEIYEMLKCEPYWLSELSMNEYPWTRQGYRVIRQAGRNDLTTDAFSALEMRILEEAFAQSCGMTFDQRTRETHGMDWVEGSRRPDESMAYEDMIAADHVNRAELIEDLQAMGPRLVL